MEFDDFKVDVMLYFQLLAAVFLPMYLSTDTKTIYNEVLLY